VFLTTQNNREKMELKTWKRLFSVFIISEIMGIILLLFNPILSIFLMVVGTAGLIILAWKRWKIVLGRYSWLNLVILKQSGKFPENLEQEKMPSWLFAWVVCTPFILILDLFLESELRYIGLLLSYSWIISLILIVFYLFVIKQ